MILQKKFTMINNEDFSNRLKTIIEFFGESASSFSEKIKHSGRVYRILYPEGC